ncbi:MAG: hypothetical protein SFU98_02945 [Leptospiraceae bacterium]|nr:hypothetical protein [Leptospiraceae bacterium]
MELVTENSELLKRQEEENLLQILQKIFDEFVLITSGYYDLKNEPLDFEMNFLKEEVAIEFYSVQTGIVSAISGVMPMNLRLPASIIEFFLNNRIHGEMIMRISKKQRKELQREEFLYCISNTGKISNLYGENLNLEKYFQKMAVSLSKNLVKSSSQTVFDVFTGGVFSFVPFINSILSGVFTYEESKNIAINARSFIDTKPLETTL